MAKIQDTITQVMAQDVSRAEFLKMTGVAFLGIVGISHLMQSLSSSFGGSTRRASRGYSSSAYGQ